jgi:hypothetical protein
MFSRRHALSRLASLGGFVPLPSPQRRHVGRWLRGWAESLLLDGADAAVVSYGKSGRTWLRLMLSRFYQRRYGLPEGTFLEYDNLSRRAPGIPTLFFTHGNYLRDFTGHFDAVAEDFRNRRVLLLVRDPRDVAVSQFFQWSHRMDAHKKWLNRYPPKDDELTVWQFVAEHEAGLDRAISFLNVWAEAASKLEAVEVVRYEDMRSEPEVALHRVLRFLGADPDPAEVRDAVEYARFDNMRRLEEGLQVSASGRRLVPGERGKSDSYKVRRAKVGGWRDYFDEEQIAALDARVRAGLRPGLGYTSAEQGPVGDAPVSGDMTSNGKVSV